jgi:hypothetical protein
MTVHKKEKGREKPMKSKSMLGMITILVILLSACGAKAVPTVGPALVQASAVAAASTMLAMTQAAMPAETSIPPTDIPTDTPRPTPTIPPLPTNPVLSIPVLPSPTAVTSSSSGGPCGGPIIASKGESLATILINNKTNVLLQVSLYLAKNSWGDCGFWSSPAGIPSGSSITTSLPDSNSCYQVTAFTLSGKPNFMNYGSFCTGSLPAHYIINVTTVNIIVQ